MQVRLKPDTTQVRLKPDTTQVRLKPDTTLAAPDLRRFERDLNAVDGVRAEPDLARLQIDALGDLLDGLVNDSVITALREDVDQHRDRQRLVEDRIFRVHGRPP